MATIVWVKVYKYFMNGRATGHLYLNRNSKVLWHNQATNRRTEWHGEWHTTHNGRALNIHFDYDGIRTDYYGRPQMHFPKWTWIKDFDGIDYEGRWIAIEFVCNYTSHDGGQTYVQIPIAIDDISIQRDEWEILPANPDEINWTANTIVL